MRVPALIAVTAITLLATGCDHMTNQQQRALSGGAIGAAGGAALGAVTGMSVLTGVAIGGAGGAAVGALTGDSKK